MEIKHEREVFKILQQTQEQGRLTQNEVLIIEEFLKEQSIVIDILRRENFILKENLPGLQPLDKEYQKYRKKAQETITGLELQLNEMRITVNGLDRKICELGMDVVNTEDSKTSQLFELNDRWEERLKNLDVTSKLVLEELVKRHCDVKKEFENIIQSLKEQVSQKEAEVAWSHLLMKERKKVMTKEVLNFKIELRASAMKEQELLRNKMVVLEKQAHKMMKKCVRLKNAHGEKRLNLDKDKDLPLDKLQL